MIYGVLGDVANTDVDTEVRDDRRQSAAWTAAAALATFFLTEAGKLVQFVQRPRCGLRATGFINLCLQVAYVKVGLLQAGYCLDLDPPIVFRG